MAATSVVSSSAPKTWGHFCGSGALLAHSIFSLAPVLILADKFLARLCTSAVCVRLSSTFFYTAAPAEFLHCPLYKYILRTLFLCSAIYMFAT